MTTGRSVVRLAPVPTLTEWAIEEVRRRILVGELPPGERLPLDELARSLGISRVPLREAVRSLEAEGLVAATPRRGVVTTELDLRNAEDAFALLETAQVLAVERVALGADAASLATMEANLVLMRKAVEGGELTAASLQPHRDFHFTFFDLVGEGVLLRNLRMLWNTCERYMMAAIPTEGRAEHSLLEHEEMLRLIREGEVEATQVHLRRHLRKSLNAVRDRLEDDASAEA